MTETYVTRCKTCGARGPVLGKKGSMGLPTAAKGEGSDLLPPRFGAVYDALAGVSLLTPEVDRYFAFLQEHRAHVLQLVCSDDDLSHEVRPWKPAAEARLRPNARKGYERAFYGAECERCGQVVASTVRERLRRFDPSSVGPKELKGFVDDVLMGLDIDITNGAGGLPFSELRRLGNFMHKHAGHRVRVTLLPTPASRKAFLVRRPGKGGRSRKGPAAPASADEWWSRLEQTGWTAEVPADEAARIRKALAAHEGDLAGAYRVLSPAGYDAECVENQGDYQKWVVPAYVAASCGAFLPAEIRDKLERKWESVTLSIVVGGRAFARDFNQPDDYVADGVHDFMNEILESLGEKRRFHRLPTGDQTAALVCVKPETLEKARRLGLVPEGGD